MQPYTVYVTAGLMIALVITQVFRRGFDPFAPIWLFLAGYAQVYVIQALSYRSWAIQARGAELVARADLRALWALVVFLIVYHCGLGKLIAARLPRAPREWSSPLAIGISPFLFAWGLICSGYALHDGPVGAEEGLFRQFPAVMLVSGVLLIVTGRQPAKPNPGLTLVGLGIAGLYLAIWMFNGKRSHSIFAVLTTVAAWYVPRLRRPGLPILGATAVGCTLVVSVALGWRGNHNYEQSSSGFVEYLGDFNPETMLINLNLKDRFDEEPDTPELATKETEEIGGFLLMLATVPEKSGYDYGAPYLRIVSTFIPRIVWPDKPVFGREKWVSAWIAGSQFPRDETFTGPAIGVLGAAQLNGGAWGTAIVMAALALLIRTAYDYYRFHALSPWAQAWWALTYYNAWFMTVNDDPFVWFYYNYGFTTFPMLVGLWLANRLAASPRPAWAAA